MKENKLWFRAKRYGLGWYPLSWQGWLVVAIYVFIIVKTVIWADHRTHSVSDFFILFAPYYIIITGLFLIICYKKGERPKWRWGK